MSEFDASIKKKQKNDHAGAHSFKIKLKEKQRLINDFH